MLGNEGVLISRIYESHYKVRFINSANLLSIIQTCRFQHRSVMDFLTQALMASTGVIHHPSLIPQFDT